MTRLSSWTPRWLRRSVTSVAIVVSAAALLGGGGSAAAAAGSGWWGHYHRSPSVFGSSLGQFSAILPYPGFQFFAGLGLGRVHGVAPNVYVGANANPVGVAFDPSTHTLYVASGNNNTVSVINTARCNALNASGCNQTPVTVTGSSFNAPLSVAIDQQARTVYVTNVGGNTVSMINAATCNATNTSGCGQSPQSVTVGSSPNLLAIDQSTNTVYVPNGGNDTLSVLDAATCNATQISGCADTSSVALPVGSGPGAVALNRQTRTAYVANYNTGTVSVINAATCDATVRVGCANPPLTFTVGPLPDALVVDQASDTVYAAIAPTGDASLGSVAMINGATCNANATSGCAQAPRTTPAGSAPEWITENPATRTVYVANQEDSDLSVINAANCNATDAFGCRQAPPALASGFNDGGVDVDPTTDTIYVASQNNSTVSVLNGATCNRIVTFGCTRFAPATTTGNSPSGIAANPSTNTVYVENRSDDTVSVVDTADCNAFNTFGCGRAWPTIHVGTYAQNIAVDRLTDTIYTVNAADNTVSVINGATCNATNSSGCGQTPSLVTVGSAPVSVAVDGATDTIYVANIGDNTVSVINGATCNGTNSSGCGRVPPTVAVGNGPDAVAVNATTNTIYVANSRDNTVSVINGATCDAAVTSGCGLAPPTVRVGSNPYQLAADPANNTIYVANRNDNTVSLINGATCNGTVITGCAPTPTVAVEDLPSAVAVDQLTDTVYVTSIADSDVATINGATCNARNMRGCAVTPVAVRMGGWPQSIVVDPSARTFYASQNVDGTVSLFGLARF